MKPDGKPDGRTVVEQLVTGEDGSPKLEFDAVGKTIVAVAVDAAIAQRLRAQRLYLAEMVALSEDTDRAAVKILRME